LAKKKKEVAKKVEEEVVQAPVKEEEVKQVDYRLKTSKGTCRHEQLFTTNTNL